MLVCGGEDYEPARPPYFVECKECYQVASPDFDTEDEAIAWWNSRRPANRKIEIDENGLKDPNQNNPVEEEI